MFFFPGNVVTELGHTIFNQSFLGSRDHGGFLFVRSTFQCVQKFILPQPPYLFGILLQKWETPWAKVFPVRLMLRLGAEYRCKYEIASCDCWRPGLGSFYPLKIWKCTCFCLRTSLVLNNQAQKFTAWKFISWIIVYIYYFVYKMIEILQHTCVRKRQHICSINICWM